MSLSNLFTKFLSLSLWFCLELSTFGRSYGELLHVKTYNRKSVRPFFSPLSQIIWAFFNPNSHLIHLKEISSEILLNGYSYFLTAWSKLAFLYYFVGRRVISPHLTPWQNKKHCAFELLVRSNVYYLKSNLKCNLK